MRTPAFVVVLSAIFTVTGCASGDGSDDAGHDHHPSDAGDATGSCAPNGAPEVTFESGRVLTFTTDPSPMPLNALFTMAVTVAPESGGTLPAGLVLDVDATMPAHGHGMNTTPVVESSVNGSFSVSGMQLHMPGTWRFAFEVTESATSTIIDDGDLTVACAE